MILKLGSLFFSQAGCQSSKQFVIAWPEKKTRTAESFSVIIASSNQKCTNGLTYKIWSALNGIFPTRKTCHFCYRFTRVFASVKTVVDAYLAQKDREYDEVLEATIDQNKTNLKLDEMLPIIRFPKERI